MTSAIKYLFSWLFFQKPVLSVALAVFMLVITPANAGIVSLTASLFSQTEIIKQEPSAPNSQNMPLLQMTSLSALNARGGGGITIVNGNALATDYNLLGDSTVDFITSVSDQISVYVVKAGDSLSQIAEMFQVSVNTIRWANDINRSDTIREGQVLVILPISGVRYEVKKGDTLASIAKDFKGDVQEIAQFNDLETGASLTLGSMLIIPHGEIVPSSNASVGDRALSADPASTGYFIRPIKGGTKTQDLHGYNGVDLASFYGAEIYAAADGTVIVSRQSGWNGGYGNYIVIRHSNGTQTLYAHLSAVTVSQGQTVSSGQVIGYMGSTGQSTGVHLHFEVRGARNPF